MSDCPNFKPGWNGDCIYYGEEYDEDDGHLVIFCSKTGQQLSEIEECEIWWDIHDKHEKIYKR